MFSLDEECNVNIIVLPYEDLKEDTEIDNEGFLYWLQFTFHKELKINCFTFNFHVKDSLFLVIASGFHLFYPSFQ